MGVAAHLCDLPPFAAEVLQEIHLGERVSAEGPVLPLGIVDRSLAEHLFDTPLLHPEGLELAGKLGQVLLVGRHRMPPCSSMDRTASSKRSQERPSSSRSVRPGAVRA